MAGALSESAPRPVSVVAIDGTALDNRNDTDRIQVPARTLLVIKYKKLHARDKSVSAYARG